MAMAHTYRWGSLMVTFYGSPAHQVGEGKMQWPLRGEVSLSQGPHSLAHLQKQLGTRPAHSPSPGQLQAGRGGKSRSNISTCVSDATVLRVSTICPVAQTSPSSKSLTTPGPQVTEYTLSQRWTKHAVI